MMKLMKLNLMLISQIVLIASFTNAAESQQSEAPVLVLTCKEAAYHHANKNFSEVKIFHLSMDKNYNELFKVELKHKGYGTIVSNDYFIDNGLAYPSSFTNRTFNVNIWDKPEDKKEAHIFANISLQKGTNYLVLKHKVYQDNDEVFECTFDNL